jgi:hypothetical protein
MPPKRPSVAKLQAAARARAGRHRKSLPISSAPSVIEIMDSDEEDDGEMTQWQGSVNYFENEWSDIDSSTVEDDALLSEVESDDGLVLAMERTSQKEQEIPETVGRLIDNM